MQQKAHNTSAPKASLDRILEQVNSVILGKPRQIRLALACLLSKGHLLIEDLPGVGKTTLAHTLARVLGLEFQRIQFTSDLLPADILGVSVYRRESGGFHFHPGPIFSQVILADEINRATPKTQSALLESMEEQQVTIEGETRALPEPFFVIATQNPADQVGTFPLPESQLDRFLMRITLGFPDNESERLLLQGKSRRSVVNTLQPAVTLTEFVQLQDAAAQAHIADPLLNYLQAILAVTREHDEIHSGLSPRAGLAVKGAAQAWALLEGRNYVVPEDVQAVLIPVISHRLKNRNQEPLEPEYLETVLLKSVPVP
ncbi:MAG TPA: MoxR family ATPase [Gammaproteobacteria bacterium]|nr:MoxR family ATPase [Gammaproteobacteria bacterium]